MTLEIFHSFSLFYSESRLNKLPLSNEAKKVYKVYLSRFFSLFVREPGVERNMKNEMLMSTPYVIKKPLGQRNPKITNTQLNKH